MTYKFEEEYNLKKRQKELLLYSVQNYKRELIDKKITSNMESDENWKEDKISVITRPLPRFLWTIRIFDATSIDPRQLMALRYI